VRVAAIADLHVGRSAPGDLHAVLGEMFAAADVLALCGDLTDHGLPEEAQLLVKALGGSARAPVVAVLGNHDHEAGRPEEVARILREGAIHVLDGDSVEIHGIGFAGVKGFGGGFGAHALQPWGEELIKRFVHEAIEEALKLERAIARLGTEHRVVLMHYAPIEDTVRGESAEIYPYLGSSRLEEPLGRHPVSAIFHGHAHHGQPRGRTRTGVPVYNVAAPLLASQGRPFHVLELRDGAPPGADEPDA
jgi:Icc-related predicted phosphoesterase